MSRAFLILALLLPAAGCASAQAKAPVESVALEVPSAPPRVIEPVTLEVPQPAQADTTTAPAPPPAVTKPKPSSRDSPRAEPKPETVKPDVVEPEVPPPAPVAPLRTGAQSNGPEVEKQIRESLTRNKTLLDSFDARNWSEDRKTALETAKDSIVQADQALKAGNVVLARNLADRAENIAKQLVGR
jgi:hypothetical protein